MSIANKDIYFYVWWDRLKIEMSQLTEWNGDVWWWLAGRRYIQKQRFTGQRVKKKVILMQNIGNTAEITAFWLSTRFLTDHWPARNFKNFMLNMAIFCKNLYVVYFSSKNLHHAVFEYIAARLITIIGSDDLRHKENHRIRRFTAWGEYN